LCNESEDSFADENTEPARVPKLAGGELATRTIGLYQEQTGTSFHVILKFSYWTWQKSNVHQADSGCSVALDLPSHAMGRPAMGLKDWLDRKHYAACGVKRGEQTSHVPKLAD
jgi:hypothetical protein